MPDTYDRDAALHKLAVEWVTTGYATATIGSRLFYSRWASNHQLEPPRRPPSWYPGQPEPPRPRSRPCTCFYGLRALSGIVQPDNPWGYVRCFVIVFDCPHHGDARYDPELLKGFTPAGEALFWETLDEAERHD